MPSAFFQSFEHLYSISAGMAASFNAFGILLVVRTTGPQYQALLDSKVSMPSHSSSRSNVEDFRRLLWESYSVSMPSAFFQSFELHSLLLVGIDKPIVSMPSAFFQSFEPSINPIPLECSGVSMPSAFFQSFERRGNNCSLVRRIRVSMPSAFFQSFEPKEVLPTVLTPLVFQCLRHSSSRSNGTAQP